MKKTALLVTTLLFTLSAWAQDISYDYHPHNKTVAFTSSNLPIVVIKLDEKMKSKSEDQRTSATITILERQDGQNNLMSSLNGSPDYTDKNIFNYHGKIGIKFRGSTSFNNNNGNNGLSGKVPFAIRTVETDGSKRDVNILDMGAHYDWVLIAPFADKSLIRDVLTFDLQRSYFDYTPRSKYCELVVEGVYQGVYAFTARARRGESRIDLPKPGKDGDDTGGYLLNIDRYDAYEDGFYSENLNRTSNWEEMLKSGRNYRTYFQCIYPDSVDYTPAQFNYIKTFINDLEDSLLDVDFDDPTYGRYREYIDVTSAIDYILTQEFTHNADGYRLSTPIYKYNDAKDPRLKFSIWDINMAFGNISYLAPLDPMTGRVIYEGWLYNNINDWVLAENHSMSVPFWFPRLMQDESFVDELRQRWCQYRSTTHSDEQLNFKIDSLAILLEDAQARNYQAWPVLANNSVFPNGINKNTWPEIIKNNTWEEHIGVLKSFLSDRVWWMDNEFGLAPVAPITNGSAMPTVACAGVKVTITANPATEEGWGFKCWEGEGADKLENANSATTSYIVKNGSKFNLTATYAPTIGTENTESTKQKSIYPNPAGEYIKIGNLEKDEAYTIINQIGKILLSGTAYNEEPINITALPSGAYIVKTDGNSLFFIKK